MPQELTGYADFGVLGLTIIALMLALAWVTRQWMAERNKNDTLQQARLDDAKSHLGQIAQVGEAMRVTMADNTSAMEANTKAFETLMARDGRVR